ncbi:MAG: cysteine--tRNA ligase [Propionibacteriaceae bacterium]|nr:cysteine--tRNA ligase [Propionibacteriaceae bacterium]
MVVSFLLYDSVQRQIVPFEPTNPGVCSIYHCGLTVQAAPHLGHLRKEVIFDVLRRWLTHIGYEVKIVANVTDIDDKILRKSAEQGIDWYALAYHFELELHKAYAALGCTPPAYEPRATGHIPEMIELITAIIANGHGYLAEDGSGDVYFDVRSWPSYGTLSGQQLADMLPADDAPAFGKRDPRDFALWKGYKPEEPLTASWDSPWGRGRPGWHIECSAMAGKYLGATFDIHGGGMDLKFPHHENEMAQAQAGGRPFAKYWMHNGLLTMAGEKMSKSLGNTAAVTEVVKRFPPRAVRFYLLAPHYRSTVELSDSALGEASAQLNRLDAFLNRGCEAFPQVAAGEIPVEFCDAMNNDLGTPAAVAVLFGLIRAGNHALDVGDADTARQALTQVLAMIEVLGLNPNDPVWDGSNPAHSAANELKPILGGLVEELLSQRQQAKERKDFAAADGIRAALTQLGFKVEDTKDGARWSLE